MESRGLQRIRNIRRTISNFIGHLKNVPDSSVAVTGCLEKPGDKMHITMIAPIEAKSSIFELDFNGQVTALENPQKHQTGIDPHLVCYKLLFDCQVNTLRIWLH